VLTLPAALAAELRRQAASAYPEECCGVLLGTAAAGGDHVREARACANARSGARGRYAIAAHDLIAAQRDARERGLLILGFYHSHPDHPPEPSATDLAEAYWEDCCYVIVATTAAGAGEIRAWRLHVHGDSRRLDPEPLEQPLRE
jgi:proteasome lid subunit RPN8/RPN11